MKGMPGEDGTGSNFAESHQKVWAVAMVMEGREGFRVEGEEQAGDRRGRMEGRGRGGGDWV
jgi:hypothetical protein